MSDQPPEGPPSPPPAGPPPPSGGYDPPADPDNRPPAGPYGAPPGGPPAQPLAGPSGQPPAGAYGAPPGGPYGAPPGPAYGPPPQWGYGPPPLPRREHPDASLVLGLGIASLVSAVVLCGVLLPLAPIAWVKGDKALAEIAASRGTVSGDETVRAGRVCGIIGTILLGIWLIGLVTLLLIAAG